MQKGSYLVVLESTNIKDYRGRTFTVSIVLDSTAMSAYMYMNCGWLFFVVSMVLPEGVGWGHFGLIYVGNICVIMI